MKGKRYVTILDVALLLSSISRILNAQRKSWVWAPVPAVFAEYGVHLKKERPRCVREASLADLERKSVLTFDDTNGKMNVHLIF